MTETVARPNVHRTSRRGWPALLAICMGFFVIQLDATIVNVALPAIQRDLGGSVSGLQWVIDAYTLALAATLLTAGSIGDRAGARRIYLIGLLVFGAASAACGDAPDLGTLIAARALQGLGAATLLPSTLALIVHQFPEARARARALGVWGGVAAVGLAAGPVLGGMLVTLVSWRVVFLVNVPICVATALLLRAIVDETERRPETRTDVVCPLLAVVVLGCLAGGLIETGPLGWVAPLPVTLLAAGAAGAVVLVALERRHPSPMLPLGIFRSRAFSAAVAVGLLFNLCLYGTLICLSLFLQRSLGEPALKAGAMLLPLTLAIAIGATTSGQLTARLGPGPPMIAGMVCGAVGALLISLSGASGPLVLVLAGSIVLGFCSLAMPAMTSVAVGALGATRSGLASGVLNSSRQTGGALGVAVLGALLSSSHAPATHALLATPLRVALAGYLVAVCLCLVVHRATRRS